MYELRDYQTEAVDSVIADLKDHNKCAVIMPTGSGKTLLFIDISRKFLAQNPDKSVFIMSHLSILTAQTTDRFAQFTPDIKVGILQARQQPDYDSQVIISTMQSSRVEDKIKCFKDHSRYQVGLVIIDECHLLYSMSYDRALSYFPDVKVIGFTATPYRNKAIMTGWFDKLSYSIAMKDLIEKGWLVHPRLIQIKKRGDDIKDIISTVVGLYKEKENGKQTIIYMQTIEDAKLLRNVLFDNNISAACVTSDIVCGVRNKIFEDFDLHRVSVLTTVNVLSLGFDAPCIEVIMQPYATSSPINYIQRIGRGLRPYKDKSECRVYVFGSAPSIDRRVYEKLDNIMLYGEKKKEYASYSEEFELNYWDEKKEVYHWTASVVECVEHMRKIGMPNFADMLNEKRFPQKFMDDIRAFLDKLPDRTPCVAGRYYPASDQQLTLLSKLGFDLRNLTSLTKGEASAMISVMYSGQTNPEWERFVLQSGKFKGTHVSQLPYQYRMLLLTQYSKSNSANLLREWNQRRGQNGTNYEPRS